MLTMLQEIAKLYVVLAHLELIRVLLIRYLHVRNSVLLDHLHGRQRHKGYAFWTVELIFMEIQSKEFAILILSIVLTDITLTQYLISVYYL